MLQSENRHLPREPICKKIQNYIFKFSDVLGQGNFSKVFKAHHEITNEIVAIKTIELNSLKSKKLEELLFSEIEVLKKLNHPNILRCFEVFTSNRNCYIITEICNGGDLESKLRREKQFSERSIEPIIKDIFSGLLYLAEKNVIHRDLKVANVFLHNGRAKIADFGFAKFTKENFKDINIGSPIYMSPEGLIHNIYGPKTDIWAFGVLIYELLHGETPFAHCKTEPELKQNVNVPLNPNKLKPELSAEIKQVITLCMEVDENKRVDAFQLEQLPYFKRIMDKSPLKRFEEPNSANQFSSQRLMSSNNLYNQKVIQRHNFLVPNSEQHFQSYDRKSKSPFTSTQFQHENSGLNERNFSTDKRTFAYGDEKDITPKTSSNSERKSYPSKIFSKAITFKESVSILHYCRLMFKYITSLKSMHPNEESQIKMLSSWVLLIIDEIKRKINEGGIVYEGENFVNKEKKLREVTNEYSKKYSLELTSFHLGELNLQIIMAYIQTYFTKIDQQILNGNDEAWTFLGHYIVMILETTNTLKKSYDEENYKVFSNLKELEVFLTKNRDQMDIQSYKIIRKKVSFIKEQNQQPNSNF